MTAYLYSLRMRADHDGRHLGGAERLVPESQWLDAVDQMSARARGYSAAATVNVMSQLVPLETVSRTPALPLRTIPACSMEEAREHAARALQEVGVNSAAVRLAFELLDRGPGPGGSVMRGAVILNPETGQRREPDPERGVRATRMDYTAGCREDLHEKLELAGIHRPRVVEALAVATKVIWSGALAELCWSDDPLYVAGYTATRQQGYCRYEQMKAPGIALGGRVIFLEGRTEVAPFVERLQGAPLLFDRLQEIG